MAPGSFSSACRVLYAPCAPLTESPQPYQTGMALCALTSKEAEAQGSQVTCPKSQNQTLVSKPRTAVTFETVLELQPCGVKVPAQTKVLVEDLGVIRGKGDKNRNDTLFHVRFQVFPGGTWLLIFRKSFS